MSSSEFDREQIVRTTVPEAGAITRQYCNHLNDISRMSGDSVISTCFLHVYLPEKRIPDILAAT